MIIYLHGFNSAGNTSKAMRLKQSLPHVYTPTYPSNNPDKAVIIINELVVKHQEQYDTLMFIGSSLGGFYARYFGYRYDAKTVLINPSLDPQTTLQQYLGKNRNYSTGEEYELTVENIESLTQYESPPVGQGGALVLLDKGDEVIDYKYAESIYRDIAHVIVYPGGSHRFDHLEDALPEIKGYYDSIWL